MVARNVAETCKRQIGEMYRIKGKVFMLICDYY